MSISPQLVALAQSTMAAVSDAGPSGAADTKIPDSLVEARKDFDAYLRERKAAKQFLDVTKLPHPIRRVDKSRGKIDVGQLAVIDTEYEWHGYKGPKGRWMKKVGDKRYAIIKEDEIYDKILSYQRVVKRGGPKRIDAVWDFMKPYAEGVDMSDTRKANEIWEKYNLGTIPATDDRLWNDISIAKIGYFTRINR